MTAPAFLPASFRPAAPTPPPNRRNRIRRWSRGLGILALMLGVGWTAAQWKIAAVEVIPCPGFPASEITNLEQLEGLWIGRLDLEAVRETVERWPGIASVAVEFKLPSTLRVEAWPDEICGSVRMGRSWRGVDCHGELSRVLDRAHPPILENFALIGADLRPALATGTRLCQGSPGRVVTIRKITPSAFRLTIQGPISENSSAVVDVLPEGAESEGWWRRAALEGRAPAWADLRFDDHVTIRRRG